jgi:serine/threonine-protein kinase
MAKVFTITEGLENMGALKTGGQGSVYKSRRIGEIITAVKLLPTPIHTETNDDRNFRDFQNEVEKLKKVNEQPNPNVVKILSSGITESGSFPFIEMEFIEGPDLEELLKPPHEPVFTIKEAIKVADHLSCALAHCHKVDVKHGDIKSNNVKLNIHSGNYVLLDFGLAIMSDEQRRTSLRHAGAIEFMAPEQNEGKMLFQTDIYSFGVILYEILAGVVPFPLADKGETSRNTVMVAHMETKPPDILLKRRQNLPENWPEAKKDHEMNVPGWIVSLIYKCLEKNPLNRFANGMELHEYITLNSTLTANKNEWSADQLMLLQQQNHKLVKEKEQLQTLLLQYQHTGFNNQEHSEPIRNNTTYVTDDDYPEQNTRPKRKNYTLNFILILLLTCGVAFIAYSLFSGNDKLQKTENKPGSANTAKGRYKVVAAKAYFHNEPDKTTRRKAFMVPSDEVITAQNERNGFIYTTFTNKRGQTSKGWLRKQDLVLVDSKNKRQVSNTSSNLQSASLDVNSQLQDAKKLLEGRKYKEALAIYTPLVEQNVPEAMYFYGNLGLKNKNEAIDCKQAFELVKKASDKGFPAAKRTLGFLYLFADNKNVLDINDYDACEYERNVFKGSKLLMEAALAGDTTAKRLQEEISGRR